MSNTRKTDAIIDYRIFYLLLVIVIAYPLMYPLGLPIPISPVVKGFYETIEELPPGSVVILDYGINAAMWPENGISMTAVLKHILKEDLKLVIISLWQVEGPMMWESRLKPNVQKFLDIKTYGEDWVDLGYVAGFEAAISGIARDLHETVPKDIHGTPLSEIPMMENLRTANDFGVAIGLNTMTVWIRQWLVPYGAPVIGIIEGMSAPGFMPYYETGQLGGFVYGTTGGAQYEIIISEPGDGVKRSDAISLGHMLVVVAIIVGNIEYFVRRTKGGTQ